MWLGRKSEPSPAVKLMRVDDNFNCAACLEPTLTVYSSCESRAPKISNVEVTMQEWVEFDMLSPHSHLSISF